MIQPFLIFSDFGILVLRVVLGMILLYHGLPKIRSFKNTWLQFEAMGFKPGVFWGTVTALLEFIGGAFLIAGFLTQIVALFVAVQFLIIILKLKRKQPLVGGYEFDLILLAGAVALLTFGSGYYSLDQFLGIWLY